MKNITAVVTHDSPLTPEKMYDAWTQPEQIKQWFFQQDSYVKCENNLEINGYFIFTLLRAGQEIQHLGHYLDLQRPNFLQFTWGVVDDLPTSSLVTIEIEMTPTGSQVTLAHQMDAEWENVAPQIKQSWMKMLQRIDQSV